jgi:hypothetical protein
MTERIRGKSEETSKKFEEASKKSPAGRLASRITVLRL